MPKIRTLTDHHGTIRHYRGVNLHREDGPAIETRAGDFVWCIRGQLHRTDGPAIIRRDGSKEWWIKGQEYEATEWMIRVHEMTKNVK